MRPAQCNLLVTDVIAQSRWEEDRMDAEEFVGGNLLGGQRHTEEGMLIGGKVSGSLVK